MDKPEVIEMADLLDTSTDDVIGKLLRVWIWFDQQSKDGNAGSVTGNVLMRFIDKLVASQGFAKSMEKVGWLTEKGLPNFARHNGETAKKRALTRDRVSKARKSISNANVTLGALPEKRREELISPTPFTRGGSKPNGKLPNGWQEGDRPLYEKGKNLGMLPHSSETPKDFSDRMERTR